MQRESGVSVAEPPVIVVTSDSHVGPLLNAQLRQYCPQRYLDAFDDFAASASDVATMVRGYDPKTVVESERRHEDVTVANFPNAKSRGSCDVYARLRDMDRDGVAAEVIFHGTANPDGVFELIPFQPVALSDETTLETAQSRELSAVGRHIYNEWLADFCSVSPERHIGLCQVPIWDIEAAIAEVQWAAEHRLRGVNFPYPQPELPSFEDTAWDPFFASCVDLGMPLCTHIGTKTPPPYIMGPGNYAVRTIEKIFMAGRALWHLIFAGVFDRHPNLVFSVHEAPGTWWSGAVRDMDSAYDDIGRGGPEIRAFLQLRPSDYVRRNMYIGVSFQSPVESKTAIDAGLADRVMWGSDYPHPEGTWFYAEHDDDPVTTRLSLAHAFAGLHEPDVRRMAGGSAIDCYHLDTETLQRVAERIGPTVKDLTTPPDLSLVPTAYKGLAFRTAGALS
jgi:predicted TIM-barrel fold metal-dependent hydrolase